MRRYKRHNVSLEPTVDALVLAEADRRGIAYSRALSSLVLDNGRAAGTAITAARLSIATARRRLEVIIGAMQAGTALKIDVARELQSMLVAAARRWDKSQRRVVTNFEFVF